MKLSQKIKWLALAFMLLLVLFGLHYYYYIYHASITDTEREFLISDGESFEQISARLKSEDLLSHSFYWQLHVRFQQQTQNLKSGNYKITLSDTLDALLQKFIRHDVILEKFTIFEGWTSEQILQAMLKTPTLRIDSADSNHIARKLGVPEGQPLEGWIYPDTYQFNKMTSNIKVLIQGYEKMKEMLEKYWPMITDDSPLKTMYELLILASIVEKEATLNAEKRRIAGVFISRLKRGMRLQSDPTVIYGLGKEFNGNIRKKDLRTDTPYNTYTRHGLPPTPIAMPDKHSLSAVAQPTITGDLYFVAKGDNSHVFSKTYEEHQQAVIQYQRKR